MYLLHVVWFNVNKFLCNHHDKPNLFFCFFSHGSFTFGKEHTFSHATFGAQSFPIQFHTQMEFHMHVKLATVLMYFYFTCMFHMAPSFHILFHMPD